MSTDLEASMYATTKAFVEEGWSGKWTVEKAMAHRAPDCVHAVLPSSQAVPRRNNEEWAAYFANVEGLVYDAKMEMHEYTVDASQRKTVCWSSLSATTPIGPYTNEYVWFLSFDASGKKITSITEFIDTKKAEDVRAALKEADLLQHR